MEERTERESLKEEKWQTCWCCRDERKDCKMAQASAEKLEQTRPAENEKEASVLQREQLASTPELPWPKEKGIKPSVQIVRREKVKMSTSRTLAR